MNFPTNWRDRRTFLAPTHHPFANYCTDTKSEMKIAFGEDLFMNSLFLGPDPLRKNLADTIMKEDNMAPKIGKNKLEKEPEIKMENETTHMNEDYSPLSGISNFFSGVLNVISNAMFSKRKPADFSSDSKQEMALPSMWHGANLSDENKILQHEISDDMSSEFFAAEMSDCRSAVAQCQSKLEQVRVLLGQSKPAQCSLRVRRRPKKVLVDASSVEECFVDAFSPEDFESLATDAYIEYQSPVCYHEHVFHETDGPKVKVDTAVAPKVAPESPKVDPVPLKVDEPVKVPEIKDTVAENPEMAIETSKMPVINSEIQKTESETPKVPSEKPTVNVKMPKSTAKDPYVCETTEIVKTVPEKITDKLVDAPKKALIESCEDKITKLKLLLQERRKKPKITEPEPEPAPLPPLSVTLEAEVQPLVKLPPRPKPSSKVKDKRYKNPNRTSDKRRKCRMRKNIHDDALFANELNSEELSSSVENSPSTGNMENYIRMSDKPVPMEKCNRTQPKPVLQKEYFDEVSGRFHSSSVDSEDSFQIVFSDSPKLRRVSDCDSEDSFIIFEDSPDSCYTSNDVFGDSTDSEEYDSDSDMSDSGCGMFKLSASLSKSVNNLADDSLYEDHSEDEVDCANVKDFSCVMPVCVGDSGDIGDGEAACDSQGLLIDEKKKMLRKNLPAKKVHFSPLPPKVHVMRVWLYAAKQTRMRYWEQFVIDRDRFKRRIADVDMAVSWVLKPQHRSRVMFQRFMPWWNAQKRKELAEKKEREAQEKLKEEERLKEIEMQKEKEEVLVEEGKITEDGTCTATKGASKTATEDVSSMTTTGHGKIKTASEHGSIKTATEDWGINTATRDINAATKNGGSNTATKDEGIINTATENGNKEKKDGNDSLIVKEINCHNNATVHDSKNVIKQSIDTAKLDQNLYSGQIVPFNEKILELNAEYVSGILNT